MKDLKKTLLASVMSIAFSMVLLVGVTFAVFTGSVTNTGNKITAGILKMGGYAYDSMDTPVEGGTTVTVGDTSYYFGNSGQDLRADNKASITNFDPTKTYAKLYEVKNEGTLAFKCKFDFFNSFDGGLGDILWFDFVPLSAEGTLERELNKKNLSAIEDYLDTDTEGNSVEKNQSKKYLFLCGLQENQGVDYFKENYSGYNFTFDIEIKAAQPNGEFPTIPQGETLMTDISDAAGIDMMMKYIANGNSVEANVTGQVQLDNVMTLESNQTVKLNICENAVFDILNQITSKAGFEDSQNNDPYTGKAAITVKEGATLELTGEGILKSDDYYAIKVEEGGTVKIDGVTIDVSNGYKSGIYAIYSQGSLTVNNATIKAFTDNDIKVSVENPSPLGGSNAYGINAAGGTLTVDGCNIEVTGATNGNTGNGAYGIYVNGAKDVVISNTEITGTGEGTSQKGIYCFDGNIKLISNVALDIKGTALDTWMPIEKIEKSTLKGSTYSLYNRSNSPINISGDTVLDGKTSGEINQIEEGTVEGADSAILGLTDFEEDNQTEESTQSTEAGAEGENPQADTEQMEDGGTEEIQLNN